MATLKVTLDADDVSQLVVADGRSIDAWIADTVRTGGPPHEHFKRLLDGTEAISGSLVCAAELIAQEPALRIDDVIVYDGWHRASAYAERARSTSVEPIEAYLILTKMADPLLVAST